MNTTFQTISPIDGSVYVERATASEKIMKSTIAIAQSAQKGWQGTSIEDRAALCLSLIHI